MGLSLDMYRKNRIFMGFGACLDYTARFNFVHFRWPKDGLTLYVWSWLE